jgi:hypothetical protein
MNNTPPYRQRFLTPQQSPLMLSNPALDGSGTINPATLNPAGQQPKLYYPTNYGEKAA